MVMSCANPDFRGRRMKRVWVVTVLLASLTAAIFLPATAHRFVLYDDDEYVTANPVVRMGLTAGGIRWAFSTMSQSNWHPLTWISHMADVQIFGLAPWGHHLVNIVFHAAAVAMLFLTLERMTGFIWSSAFVAALFAVHPLHVESVAWVAERKDVLSGLLWMLTMNAYLSYARKPRPGRYLAVLVAFALGVMAKAMVVTLPFVLLLLDWWPLSRFGKPGRGAGRARVWYLVREKAPFLALSAIASVIAYVAQQQGGSVAASEVLPLSARLASAASGYFWYIGRTLWPSGLAVLYPHPGPIVSVGKASLSLLSLTALIPMAMSVGKRWPWLTVGWFWYLGTLVPVIGLVQVGIQFTADRYSYLPLVGLFIAMVWMLDEATRSLPLRRAALGVAGGAVLIALTVVSTSQLRHWRDDLSLFRRAVSVTTNNAMAWLNLGAAYSEAGQWREAIAACREALKINPSFDQAWFNLGVANGELGHDLESAEAYGRAVTVNPKYAEAWQGLAHENEKLSRWAGAAQAWRRADELQPRDARVLYRLGRALAIQGDRESGMKIARELALLNRVSAAQLEIIIRRLPPQPR